MTTDRGRRFAQLVAIELSAQGRRNGITQKAIAEAAGITPEQMSFYVHGRKGAMTTATLLEAAEHLGISPRVIADRAYQALLDELGPREDVRFAVTTETVEHPAPEPARPGTRGRRPARRRSDQA